jgi:hypothetical protein
VVNIDKRDHHNSAESLEISIQGHHSLNMITRKLYSWNVTDDSTVGDSEFANAGTSNDLDSFIFYSALGTVLFLIACKGYFQCRNAVSVVVEIPEPQASSQGEEVVKKNVGERKKELLDGFEDHKVQRVSKLQIEKTLFA